MTRTELDEELHRLWQAMDSHTHNVVEEREDLAPKAVMPTRIVIEQEPVQPMQHVQPLMVVEQEAVQPVVRSASVAMQPLMSAAPPLFHAGSRSLVIPGPCGTPCGTPTSGRPAASASRSMSGGPVAQARVVSTMPAPATTVLASSFPVQTEPIAAMPMHSSGGM